MLHSRRHSAEVSAGYMFYEKLLAKKKIAHFLWPRFAWIWQKCSVSVSP